MKGLIVVLMCTLVAVQGRSTAISKSTRTAAALGENPWVVHLRIAVSTSGLLDTCTGSLIDSSWVLTAASCLETVRFIWIRYGAVNVINPELVTENSIVSSENQIALININRVVQSTANIAPVALSAADAEAPETGSFCGYSDNSDAPGETLSCSEVTLEAVDDALVADVSASRFDIGAALVSDGVQYGVLTETADGAATFIRTGKFLAWIEEETGLDFSSSIAAVVAPESVKVVDA